jgi:hypothetical protein
MQVNNKEYFGILSVINRKKIDKAERIADNEIDGKKGVKKI